MKEKLDEINAPPRLVAALRHEIRTTLEQQLNDLWMVVHSVKDSVASGGGGGTAGNDGSLLELKADIEDLHNHLMSVSDKVEQLSQQSDATGTELDKKIRGVRRQLHKKLSAEQPALGSTDNVKVELERIHGQHSLLESRLEALEAQLYRRLEQLEQRQAEPAAAPKPWSERALGAIPSNVGFGLADLAKVVLKYDARELHIKSHSLPHTVISDELIPIGKHVLSEDDCSKLILSTLPVEKRQELFEQRTCEHMVTLQGNRFRLQAYFERNRLSAALRRLPSTVPSLDELGLPRSLELTALETNGLMLVAGGAASGRSTTLASLVDHINRQRRVRIFSLESPIEYELSDGDSLIAQQQVGLDVEGFLPGLESLRKLRPQVVMLSHIESAEVAEVALKLASGGTLVLAGVEGANAVEALEHLVALFPSADRAGVSARLGQCLRAVVAQKLLPGKSGEGPILCSELLLNTKTTADYLREGHFRLIEPTLDRGLEGMQSFRHCLAELQRQGKVGDEGPQSAPASAAPFRRRVQEVGTSVELGPPPESDNVGPPRAPSRPPEPPAQARVATEESTTTGGDDDTLLGWL